MRLLRLAIQAVLFFLLLGAVVGIAASETGALEKAVLVAFAALVIWLATLVRRIGEPSPPRSA
jgi:hypothetical protein